MTSFSYKVRDQAGVMHTGIMSAETADEASRKLRVEGKYVVELAAQ